MPQPPTGLILFPPQGAEILERGTVLGVFISSPPASPLSLLCGLSSEHSIQTASVGPPRTPPHQMKWTLVAPHFTSSLSSILCSTVFALCCESLNSRRENWRGSLPPRRLLLLTPGGPNSFHASRRCWFSPSLSPLTLSVPPQSYSGLRQAHDSLVLTTKPALTSETLWRVTMHKTLPIISFAHRQPHSAHRAWEGRRDYAVTNGAREKSGGPAPAPRKRRPLPKVLPLLWSGEGQSEH